MKKIKPSERIDRIYRDLKNKNRKYMKTHKQILGKKIHQLLNKTLDRKLTVEEYSQLVLYIAGVFDLNNNSLEVQALKKVIKK